MDETVFYDAFAIVVQDLNCYITHSRSNFRHIRGNSDDDDAPWRLIPQFDLLLSLKLRNAPIAALPQVKLSGKIPYLEVNVSHAYVKDLWRVINSLFPPSTPKTALPSDDTTTSARGSISEEATTYPSPTTRILPLIFSRSLDTFWLFIT